MINRFYCQYGATMKTSYRLPWLRVSQLSLLFSMFFQSLWHMSKQLLSCFALGWKTQQLFVFQFPLCCLATKAYLLYLLLCAVLAFKDPTTQQDGCLASLLWGVDSFNNKRQKKPTMVRRPTPNNKVRCWSVCWRSTSTSLPSPGTQSLNKVNGRP